MPKSPPKLNKIPFWITDALLVLVGCIIAFGGAPGMSGIEAAWMVFCFVTGGAVLLLPYAFEYYVTSRIHDQEHDETEWKKIEKMETALESLADSREQLDTVTQAIREGAATDVFVDPVRQQLQQQLKPAQKSLEEVTQLLQAKAQAEHNDPQTIQDTLQSALSQQEQTLSTALREHQQTQQGDIQKLRDQVQSLQEESNRLAEHHQTLADQLEQKNEASSDQPAPEFSGKVEGLQQKIEAQSEMLRNLEEQLGLLTEQFAQFAEKAPAAPARSAAAKSSKSSHLLSKAMGSSEESQNSPAMERIIRSDKDASSSASESTEPDKENPEHQPEVDAESESKEPPKAPKAKKKKTKKESTDGNSRRENWQASSSWAMPWSGFLVSCFASPTHP